ncbi:MAG: di-trans,poly-cis-decaprenylcistransferase [Clostridia bacterium]|nr:di-trans,poly-cis-decaprenylcistransferase [Clostridia bacterium]
MELAELKNNYKIPKHIAFIIDGNGRWAKLKGLPRKEGHIKGFNILEEVYAMVREVGIEYVSIYAFSTDNWNRPKEEVDGLVKLFKKAIKIFNKKEYADCKIEFFGDVSRFGEEIEKGAKDVMEKTKNNTAFHINLCLNYGGREEIVKAVNDLIKEGKTEITVQDISSHLYSKNCPDPDFIVRTSGEQRLSNFMLWQASYTELYFPKTLWPDFSKEDLIEAIKEYSSRSRRFGAIKE